MNSEKMCNAKKFGIDTKIFTIAGPVILYELVVSWALGVLYWIVRCFG